MERPDASEEKLHGLAAVDLNNTNDVFVELDGQQMNQTELDEFKVLTDVFEVEYPNNSIWGSISAGPSMAVASGRYLLTTPLEPGEHTVRFGGIVDVQPEEDRLEDHYEENMQYTLIVG